MSLQGFWSYVHQDDDAELGRIVRLSQDVVAQFEMITGDTLELFLDKDALGWGEIWKDKIEASLASGAFFIPVLTPRYFRSAECRRELQFFVRARANQKGLLLPLLYVAVPSIDEENPTDDLIKLIRTFEWEDWTNLRFVDVGLEAYRRGVHRLAKRLADTNRAVEAAVLPAVIDTPTELPEDAEDVPGLLDRMSDSEEAFPKLTKTTGAIGGQLETIGQLMTDATAQIQVSDRQGHGFGGRVAIARRAARTLAEPVALVESLSNDFTSQLHDVDQGVRVLIEQAAQLAQQAPDDKPEVCRFFTAMRSLGESTLSALALGRELAETTRAIEPLSKDLRPVLRRLRRGLTTMAEAGEVCNEWMRLIENSGVECDSPTS